MATGSSDGGNSEETSEMSLVEFCTQLDDYTPTVGYNFGRIHMYAYIHRYQTLLHCITYKRQVSTLMILECK